VNTKRFIKGVSYRQRQHTERVKQHQQLIGSIWAILKANAADKVSSQRCELLNVLHFIERTYAVIDFCTDPSLTSSSTSTLLSDGTQG
jgi:hypothetical protein